MLGVCLIQHVVTVHLVDLPLCGGLELLACSHPDVSLFPSKVWNGPKKHICDATQKSLSVYAESPLDNSLLQSCNVLFMFISICEGFFM